jgi:hypothetical protein
MEAEHYTDYFPGTGDFSYYSWVKNTSMEDASVGYFVDFSTSGSYYVWVRRAGGGSDDSCQISLDSGGIIQWSYGGGSSFEWTKYNSTFSISSGAHIFTWDS